MIYFADPAVYTHPTVVSLEQSSFIEGVNKVISSVSYMYTV